MTNAIEDAIEAIEQLGTMAQITNSVMTQYRISELTILRQSDNTKNRIIQLIDYIRQWVWVNVNEREQSDTLNQIASEIEQNINDLVNLIHVSEQKNSLILSESSELINELKCRIDKICYDNRGYF